MSGSYRLSRKAYNDLDDIWKFIAKDNVTAADHLIEKLDEKFAMLSRQPLLGELREELGMGLRSFHVGRYVIYYLPTARNVKIEIVRVMHGARDVPRQF